MPALAWKVALATHLDRYPLSEPADVAKYVLQAVHGPQHVGSTTHDVLATMRAEVEAQASLELWPDPTIIEPLGPQGVYSRIHLRAWVLASNGDLGPVAKAFRMTLGTHEAPARASRTYALVTAALQQLRPDWPRELVDELLAPGSVPHHSRAYEAQYYPCYRVVRTSLLPPI